MTHALQHNQVQQASGWSEIVRREKGFNREAEQKYTARKRRETDAAVVDEPGKSQKRNGERGPQKEAPRQPKYCRTKQLVGNGSIQYSKVY